MITIYTDGSALGNPGHSGYAYVVRKDSEIIEATSVYLGIGTNNKAELSAFIQALSIARMQQRKGESVLIVSDSRYVLNGFEKCEQWIEEMEYRQTERPNMELWVQCAKFKQALIKPVMLCWIPGHNGYPLNELCDKMAQAAARKMKGVTWMS